MFTSMLNQIHCFEGEQLQIECAVYSDNIPVEWFKNYSNRFQSVKIKANNNIIINRSGENHVLTIKNCKLCDAGLYTIQAGNVRKKTKVTIEGKQNYTTTKLFYFLLNITCRPMFITFKCIFSSI